MTLLSINQLSEQDRPREKLVQKGRASLSDAELIAILLGSGYKEKNAIALAQEILGFYKNDLSLLARQEVADLIKFKGVGEAKAISIITALELSRRRKIKVVRDVSITSSHQLYEYCKPILGDLDHEQFWVLLLNRSNVILHPIQISTGGRSGTVVDAKVVFKKALDFRASSLIMVHNHPSGNTRPSKADKDLTSRMVKAGSLLEIPILDHLIYTDNGYFSFADEGALV